MRDADALFWAEHYNAEHALEKGKDAQQKKLMEKVSQFNKFRKQPVLPEVSQSIQDAIMSGAFKAEMDAVGITPDLLVPMLEDVSRVETAGGAYNKPSPTGAAGFLQVTDGTFRDLIKRGVVGPKALKVLGKSKNELLKMNTKQRQEYLTQDNDAAAIFGAGAYLNKLNSLK